MEFVKSDDGSYYIVKGFQDGTTAEDVYIPVNYEGLPVKEIADGAFNGTKINTVTIGNNVTVIGESAFQECISLTKINIPASTKTIGEYAFANCTALEEIYYEAISANNLEVTDTFKNAGLATDGIILYIADAVKKIPTSLFATSNAGCINITSIIFGSESNCAEICQCAFMNLSELKYIVLPSSIESIGKYAFSGCNGSAVIYYCGDKNQWDILLNKVEKYNNVITSSPTSIYYYSSDYAENCWHYENGLPVLW
ncbi:MAG: leucine-rich repeat domain-containing protein [Clostridia bacterium]|nr:leucine-rich repeat domain-containing protein [Clostridia bacterium]